MTAAAVGLDYETQGAKTSTGAAMRAAQSDQSGGTDSGDAREAWSAYGESLRIMDGHTFDEALADLADGRLVHLDVWAASCGEVCLSGSGAYGHTIAVAPEHHSDGLRWLVADPWCSPPSWSWTAEADLRRGAEGWGAEVYGRAAQEPDYPVDSSGPRDPRVLLIVARIVRRAMTEAYPGHEGARRHPDTGGGGPILYTTTSAHDDGGDDMAGPTFEPEAGAPAVGQLTVSEAGGNIIATADGELHPVDVGLVRNVFGVVRISSGPYAGDLAYLVQIPGGADESGLLLDGLVDYVPHDPGTDPGDPDELEIRRDQYDLDATHALGPRP